MCIRALPQNEISIDILRIKARNVARQLFLSVLKLPIQLLLYEPAHNVTSLYNRLPGTLDSAYKAMCTGSYMAMAAFIISPRFFLPTGFVVVLVFLVRRRGVAGVQGSGQVINAGHFIRVVGENGFRIKQSESICKSCPRVDVYQKPLLVRIVYTTYS